VKHSHSSILPNSNEVSSQEFRNTSSSGSSDEQIDQEQDAGLKQPFSFGNGENEFAFTSHSTSHIPVLSSCRD
jgi:hypothetical protein